MKLVWESTGDTLAIAVENLSLVEYWVNQINISKKNSFELISSSFPLDEVTRDLSNNVKSINEILKKFNLNYLGSHEVDFLNQDNLNLIHSQWVKLQQDYNILSVLSKFGGGVIQKFHDINKLIHQIENSSFINYINDSSTTWQVINPFGAEILQFGTWQVELHYQNLGRSTYEKWFNFDNNLIDTDTNNFTHIGGEVRFHIGRPFRSSAPLEYINFCSTKNIKPYGSKLPIGNFKEPITVLRHLFNRNVSIKNNRISFTI